MGILENIDTKLDQILANQKEILAKIESKPEKPTVVTPMPPIIVEPPIVTPPSTGFTNIQDYWDKTVNDPSVNLITINGKCEVPVLKNARINRKLTIKGVNNAILKFGVENYDKWTATVKQDGTLFTLLDGAEILIQDVNICQPPQVKKTVEPVRPSIFRSAPDPNHKWTAVVMNCDTTVLGRNGGFGLGFLYGGVHQNHIAAINFMHVGSTFIDGKAAIGGSQNTILYITLDNVHTDDPNPEEYGSWRVPVTGFIKNNIFTITSDNNTNQIRNYSFSDETVGNYAYIIHIGRFTLMLKPSNVIDLKNIKLYDRAQGKIKIRVLNNRVYTLNKEGHAGDTFLLNGVTYNTKEKGRDEFDIWINSFKGPTDIIYTPYLIPDKNLADGYYDVDWTSSFNIDGIEQDAWMIYKESSYGFRSYPNTNFESWEIMSGGVMGHTMYNHRNISLWAKDVTINGGYYRQTDRGGLSLGYNMINCKGFGGEFNPPVSITTNVTMPDRIKNLIS